MKKSHEELEKELQEAKKLIKIGGIYSHFKHPENHYKIIDLAFQEATNKICVIYRADYGKKMLFVRDLDIWLENVGQDLKIERFKLVK